MTRVMDGRMSWLREAFLLRAFSNIMEIIKFSPLGSFQILEKILVIPTILL
jgi:hypothetical protein